MLWFVGSQQDSKGSELSRFLKSNLPGLGIEPIFTMVSFYILRRTMKLGSHLSISLLSFSGIKSLHEAWMQRPQRPPEWQVLVWGSWGCWYVAWSEAVLFSVSFLTPQSLGWEWGAETWSIIELLFSKESVCLGPVLNKIFHYSSSNELKTVLWHFKVVNIFHVIPSSS